MTFKKILIGWGLFFLIIVASLATALWSASNHHTAPSGTITLNENFIVIRATGMEPGYLMRGVAADDYLGKVTVVIPVADGSPTELRPKQIAPNLWVGNTTFEDPAKWWDNLLLIAQKQPPIRMSVVTDVEQQTSEGEGAILFSYDEFLCRPGKTAYEELTGGWRRAVTIGCTLASTEVMRE